MPPVRPPDRFDPPRPHVLERRGIEANLNRRSNVTQHTSGSFRCLRGLVGVSKPRSCRVGASEGRGPGSTNSCGQLFKRAPSSPLLVATNAGRFRSPPSRGTRDSSPTCFVDRRHVVVPLAQPDAVVDEFPNDVGMSRVPVGLGDHVDQDPMQRHLGTIRGHHGTWPIASRGDAAIVSSECAQILR